MRTKKKQKTTEVYVMKQNEVPLGFGFALAQDPEAMQKFASLPEQKRQEILQKAQNVSDKNEMQTLVHDLTAQ